MLIKLGSLDVISQDGGRAWLVVNARGLLTIFQLREWLVISEVSTVGLKLALLNFTKLFPVFYVYSGQFT